MEANANARLIAAAPELFAALKELLASQAATYPPFEAGKTAQDAWADRRAKARNDAAAVIAKVEVGWVADPEETTHERAGCFTNGDPR